MLRSPTTRVLLSLLLGLAAGAACQAYGGEGARRVAGAVGTLGGLWLNALRMTVVPLVFALLVTGIASVADAAATGRLAIRALVMFAVLLLFASAFTIAWTTGVLTVWPLSPHDSAALIAGVKGAATAAIPPTPPFSEWLQTLIPTNPVKAAADDAILSLVVFGVFFGFAATRLSTELRLPLVALFQAVAETMTTIVEWVLLAAPLGVFALSLGVGLHAGFGAAAVLGHYIFTVSTACIGVTLCLLVMVALSRRLKLGEFLRAAAPIQAVALSTQSSLATLPAMVEACREVLGVPQRAAGLILPLAVAVFRYTSPVANLAVVLFVAKVYGVHLGPLQYVSGVLVALACSIGSVGLPGQVSFFASIVPICLTVGAPIELLPILVAVEVVPDLFRTLGNVTADMAVTTLAARSAAADPKEAPAAA